MGLKPKLVYLSHCHCVHIVHNFTSVFNTKWSVLLQKHTHKRTQATNWTWQLFLENKQSFLTSKLYVYNAVSKTTFTTGLVCPYWMKSKCDILQHGRYEVEEVFVWKVHIVDTFSKNWKFPTVHKNKKSCLASKISQFCWYATTFSEKSTIRPGV